MKFIESIQLKEALKDIIWNEHPNSVITLYELRMYIYKLYRDGHYKGKPIGKLSLKEPESRTLKSNISNMESQGVIRQDLNLPTYFISNKDKPTAQQVICVVNPYSYIAYLTAMEWHGLTDRMPYVIHMMTCSSDEYRTRINAYINEQIPDVEDSNPITPPRIIKYPAFDKKSFEFHQTKKFKLPKEQSGSGGVRVTSIGDTFLDMLKKPDLCGGFEHVIEVFQEHGEEYLPVIVKTIEAKGSSMDKARAGYILEEECKLSHKTINKWKSSVSRGGSRKLIPSNPYIDIYSETWCISINK